MEGIDTKTMIHIGTELLLIGGLGFWMKKRVDASDAKIEELEKKLSAYEDIISQQQNLLTRHEEMLRKVFGMPPLQQQPQGGAPPQGPQGPQQGAPGPQGTPPQSGASQGTPSPSPPQPQTPAKPAPSGKSAPAPKAKAKSSPPPEKKEEVPEEKDISPEDLDKILRDELAQTQSIEIDTADPEDSKPNSEQQDQDQTEPLKPKRKVVAVRKKKTT